jgi:hypothetical protein
MTNLNRKFVSRQQINDIAIQVIGEILPGGSEQGIFDASTVQNFVKGTPRIWRNKKFRYSYASADLAALARLVINTNYAPEVTGHVSEDGHMGNPVANVPIGQQYIDLNDTVLRAANYYQGGHLIAFGAAIFHQHYIVASEAGNGTYVRIWLDHPITDEAIPTVGVGVTAYPSIYSAIGVAGSVQVGFEPFVGINLIPVSNGEWFWLQTAGLVWVTAHGGTWPGAAAEQRDVYAHQDGTIDPAAVKDPTNGYQRVGYLVPATGGTASDYGDALIMLQLDN